MKILYRLILLFISIIPLKISDQQSVSDSIPKVSDNRNIESANKLLLAAALHGNVQEIKKYMAKGAEVNCKDKNGNTPLNMVAKLSYYNLVRYFVEKGADVNTSNNDQITPLHYGVEYNNVKIVQLLLEKGANIDAQDSISETPLHWAGWTGNIETARLLLRYGANPYTPNNTDVTPLFNAIRQ